VIHVGISGIRIDLVQSVSFSKSNIEGEFNSSTRYGEIRPTDAIDMIFVQEAVKATLLLSSEMMREDRFVGKGAGRDSN